MVQLGPCSSESLGYPYGNGSASNAIVNKKEKLNAAADLNIASDKSKSIIQTKQTWQKEKRNVQIFPD